MSVGPSRTFRFSLGEFLLAIAALASVLGGWSAFGWLGAFSVAFVLGLMTFIRGMHTRKSWQLFLGGCVSLNALCGICLALLAWQLLGVGPVNSKTAWPREAREMAEVCEARPTEVKIYCLGGFIDSDYVWRMPADDGDVKRVVADYGLLPVSSEEVPGTFRGLFPMRWHPRHRSDSQYFATASFPAFDRGPDGDHFFAMYDPTNQWLYVWYKSNF